MPKITIPNDWRPRGYQMPLWTYMENGGTRGVAVWHRRAGKDDVALNWTAVAAHQRVGTYWHMLPQANQARKAVWDAVDPHRQKRRIDLAFPPELRSSTRDTDMMVRFKIGSTWQVVGSDNYNSLVGSPPIGVVFSEWALADPNAWAFLSPILMENNGWALFIYTPRGPNHGERILRTAQNTDGWFGEVLTVDDTKRFTEEQLEQERQNYIDLYGSEDIGRAQFEQEYLCSFDAPILGSYYGSIIADLRKKGRVTSLEYDPAVPVHTCWDLGIGDSTAIWFFQQVGPNVHWIDYLEHSGVGLDWYAREIKAKPYVYGDHYWPHDGTAREWGSGRTREEQARSLGLNPRIVPLASVEDGINAARMILRRSIFDGAKCERGLDALKQYRREYDEKKMDFSTRPLHDWTSHGADALRCGAMGIRTHYAPAEPEFSNAQTFDEAFKRHLDTKHERSDRRI